MSLLIRVGKIQKSRWFMMLIGFMGFISIPLLVYNLIVAPATDKIFALTDLTTMLLLFGTFYALLTGKRVKSE